MKNTESKKVTAEEIKTVFKRLQSREINPAGKFDHCGRWYADNADLINVRSPSATWKYSQMIACRTLKYVKKVAEKFNCENVQQLTKCV